VESAALSWQDVLICCLVHIFPLDYCTTIAFTERLLGMSSSRRMISPNWNSIPKLWLTSFVYLVFFKDFKSGQDDIPGFSHVWDKKIFLVYQRERNANCPQSSGGKSLETRGHALPPCFLAFWMSFPFLRCIESPKPLIEPHMLNGAGNEILLHLPPDFSEDELWWAGVLLVRLCAVQSMSWLT
jgi:hypothetical protein